MAQVVCRYFSNGGNCLYGDQCNFLHIGPAGGSGGGSFVSSSLAASSSSKHLASSDGGVTSSASLLSAPTSYPASPKSSSTLVSTARVFVPSSTFAVGTTANSDTESAKGVGMSSFMKKLADAAATESTAVATKKSSQNQQQEGGNESRRGGNGKSRGNKGHASPTITRSHGSCGGTQERQSGARYAHQHYSNNMSPSRGDFTRDDVYDSINRVASPTPMSAQQLSSSMAGMSLGGKDPHMQNLAMGMSDAGMGGGRYGPNGAAVSHPHPGHALQPHPYAQGQVYNSGGNESVYFPSPAAISLPAQLHLYADPNPNNAHIPHAAKTISSFFLSDRLREELHRRQEDALRGPDAEDQARLPTELHVYHSLRQLEDFHGGAARNPVSKVFGFPSPIYKATSSTDGKPYALRRVEGYRLGNEASIHCIESWRKIRHSSVVHVREAFTTKAFGDHSLIVVYEYHPHSQTLFSKHFASGYFNNVPERILWSLLNQMCSAIKTIHAANLAVRDLDLSKVIVTSKNRYRISSVAIMDILQFDANKPVSICQQEDLMALGQMILSLACGSLTASISSTKVLEHLTRSFSPELKNVIVTLTNKAGPKSIDDIVLLISQKLLTEINLAHSYNDHLESELSKELENARLFRLISKLGFVNERPEFDMDPAWSETGDRYLLKLFRDYVFHQVDEHGNPVVDLGHVITCLNKLDAGFPEKIMLMSRDEMSCLVVTYADVKKCLDKAFKELSRSM